MFRLRGARVIQNEKRRTSGKDRRSISSWLPRDHPPCGTPVFEGSLFVAESLQHKTPAAATNSTRVALGSASQHEDPSGRPVEGCADPLPLSGARTRPGEPREAARRLDGTTTMRHGRSRRSGLGGRRQTGRARCGQHSASRGGIHLDTEETAGSRNTPGDLTAVLVTGAPVFLPGQRSRRPH